MIRFKSEKWRELADEYANHAKHRNLKNESFLPRLRDLERFYLYMEKVCGGNVPEPESVPHSALLEYLDHRGYSVYTVRQQITSIKFIFSIYYEFGHCKTRPLLLLARSPVCPPVRRDVLSSLELKQIWKSLYPKEYPSRRSLLLAADRVVFFLLLLGLRRGEVITLRWKDFDDDTFACLCKGRKLRTFPIDGNLRSALRSFSSFVSASPSSFVVPGSPESGRGLFVGRSVRRILKRAGIVRESYASPHLFRHSMATLLFREVKDIERVRQYLGHANVATTQTYLHVTTVSHADSLHAISTAIKPETETLDPSGASTDVDAPEKEKETQE